MTMGNNPIQTKANNYQNHGLVQRLLHAMQFSLIAQVYKYFSIWSAKSTNIQWQCLSVKLQSNYYFWNDLSFDHRCANLFEEIITCLKLEVWHCDYHTSIHFAGNTNGYWLQRAFVPLKSRTTPLFVPLIEHSGETHVRFNQILHIVQ